MALHFVVWSLIAYGMTNILVYGSIFDVPREWVKAKSNFFGSLISCVLCTSTWVGFFLSITLGSIVRTLFDTNLFLCIFFDGMLSAGVVWAINSIIEFFEENRIK